MGDFILAIIIFSILIFGVARVVHNITEDAKERGQQDAARKKRREEEEARFATALWIEIKDHFPFLSTPFIMDTTAKSIYDGIGETLSFHPSFGIVLDTELVGIDAPDLAGTDRQQHLYVVGKTGSGKSSYLEHLIHHDLKEWTGIGVISPESEFFRNRLIPLVQEDRWHEVVYFAPGDPKNPVTFNPLALEPGEDRARAAEDLFTIFKRAIGEDDLGPRTQPILQNAFSALVGQPEMTLWHVKQILEDPVFREEVVNRHTDPYVQSFWKNTFPRYPRGSDLPIINRLDLFLRPPTIRNVFLQPKSSFSFWEVLAGNMIFFVDLFGLSEDTRQIIGQMILSKFQIELMRREITQSRFDPFHLYADEFQTFAGMAEGLWRDLCSRGRKYGLGLTLAHQFPGQLPTAVQKEILGNFNSMVSFSLGAQDAQVVHRELLQRVYTEEGSTLEPIPVSSIIDLARGEAYVKAHNGKAIKVGFPPPVRVGGPERTQAIIQRSWELHGATLVPFELPPSPSYDKQKLLRPPSPLIQAPDVVEPPKETTQERSPEPTEEREPVPVPKAKRPQVTQPPSEGRGGPKHKYLQMLIKRMGEKQGYKGTIEKSILGGTGSVDVALEKEEESIACEISVTTSVEHEVGNIQKCLASGFDQIIVLSDEKKSLQGIRELATRDLSEKDMEKICFLLPEEFLEFLEEREAQGAGREETVRGYKVKVQYQAVDEKEKKAKKEAIAKTIYQALKRLTPKE